MKRCNFCKERFHTDKCPMCKRKDYKVIENPKREKGGEIISILKNQRQDFQKAVFLCKDCKSSFETIVENEVYCKHCRSMNCEIKSPLVNVDNRDKNFTKAEKKYIKFIRNLMKKRVELEEAMNNVCRLMKICESHPNNIVELQEQFRFILKSIDKSHSKKIEEYKKRL